MAKGNKLTAIDEYQPSLYLDFKDAEEAAEFLESLDGTVSVAIQGKLSSVRLESDGDSSIRIEDFTIEKIDNNIFAELSKDDE